MGNASRRARQAVANAVKAAKETKGGPQPEPEVKNALLLPKPETHWVQYFRDISFEFPQLYMDVYISERDSEVMFGEMFARAACRKAETLEKADLVVFTGGADVGPSLYGCKIQDAHKTCRTSKIRDDRDMKLYADALQMRIPMLGVCRGAQFLCVMNGGSLYQHVDGHTGAHSMTTADGEVIEQVSSTHHQMVRKDSKMVVLATARKSRERWLDNKVSEVGDNHEDIEAFLYPNTMCLGVQGHPEFRGHSRFTNWTLKQIEDKIKHNPRVKPENGVYRVQRQIEV